VNPGDTTTTCTISATPPPATTPCDSLVDNVKAAAATNAALANFQSTNGTAANVLLTFIVDLFTAATKPGNSLKKYFDGTDPTGSTDFTAAANGAQLTSLAEGLTQFFGFALGCSDNSIPAYTSNSSVPNLKAIHQFMNISSDDFNAFNAAVIALLDNFHSSGVGMSTSFNTFVLTFLNTTSTDICAGCNNFQAISICEKWATAANTSQLQLIQGAVLSVFGNLTASNSPALPFFNGVTPCLSRNFITNLLNQASLAQRLTEFFGQVLGCSDPAFPAYDGTPVSGMESFHSAMPITSALFNQFVSALVAYVQTNLATAVGPTLSDDINTVAAFFASDPIAKICNQPGCPNQGHYVARQCPTTPPATTAGATSAGGSTTPASGSTAAATSKAAPGSTVAEPGTTVSTTDASMVQMAMSVVMVAVALLF